MDYRATQAVIDLGAIRENTKTIIREYPDYQYRIGVIKANCYGYGYGSGELINAIAQGGINMLAVSCVEEALKVQEIAGDLPVMILVPCEEAAYELCTERGIGISLATINQALGARNVKGLKVFIRANGGRDLFGGPRNAEGFMELYSLLKSGVCELKGIFLHNYYPEDITVTTGEYEAFEQMTSGINLKEFEIVSTSNSLTLPIYEKKPYCNAFRIGNMLYGIENTNLSLRETFLLESEIKQIVTLHRGESISYSNAHCATREKENIALIPIGYGDGFSKANAGRDVFINSERRKIITVTMDITLVEGGEGDKEGDKVILIGGNRHLDEIAAHTNSVAEEALCALNERVRRVYIDGDTER